MRQKSYDKRLAVAMQMPPRKKKAYSNDPYDPAKDEVIAWLAKQPGVMNYVADLVQRLGYIRYDPATGIWRGAVYDD